MKTFKVKKIHLAVLITASICALAVGCGTAPAAAPANTTSTAAASSSCSDLLKVDGKCASLKDACSSKKGGLIQINGADVCKLTTYVIGGGLYYPSQYPGGLDLGKSTYFPRVTPEMVDAGAFSLGTNVVANDTVSIKASGGWGGVSSSDLKIFGFNIGTTYTLTCDGVNLDGLQGTQTLTNEGQPAGLMVTEGTSAYLVGSSGSQVMSHNGTLKLGFNVELPTAASSQICATAQIQELKVQHCEDAKGTTYKCP